MAFGRRRTRTGPPSTPPGERVYAIGDVHGRLDLLRDLLDRIAAHRATLPAAEVERIVLLGDLVDRGPASADVLRLLYAWPASADRPTVLLGNHEELMLRALDGDAGVARVWMRVGGEATLRSFGVAPPERGADTDDAIARLRDAIPGGWIDWLRGLPLTARSGDYLFCHAGVRPGVPLRRQARDDLLWIRDEFLTDDTTDHGATIVHGHSISRDVAFRPYRIGIDTGAYASGVLTALWLDGQRRAVLSTGEAPVRA